MNQACIYKTKRSHRRMMLALLFLAGMPGVNQFALADVNCQPSTFYPAKTLTPVLGAAASQAGNDLPVGHAIYTTSVDFSGTVGINCDGPISLESYLTVSDSPSGAPVTMSTEYGTGPVYPTNVPGIGAIVWTGVHKYTEFISTGQVEFAPLIKDTAGDKGLTSTGVSAALTLVKTGPIASGAVVNGSSLPHISLRVPATAGYTGLPIRLIVFSFGGSLQFTTQTCTTPDVNVVMGDYDIPDNFTGPGKASQWVDSSIILQNCPVFSGYYSHYNGGKPQSSVDSGATTGGTRASNLFGVSLTPVNPVVNDIISLDDTTDAARGLGIQLGYTPDDINAIATSPQKIWTAGTSWDVVAPTDGRTTIKIPLAARYYQTESTVTPGKANAKVTFNIDYK